MVTQRTGFAALLAGLLIMPAAVSLGQPKDANLREGTRVVLVTMVLIGDDTHKGDVVRLQVDRDVKDNEGNVVIQEGADARGQVTKVDKSVLFGATRFTITAVKVRSVEGDWIPLTGTLRHTGKIPPGTKLEAQVGDDTEVDTDPPTTTQLRTRGARKHR